MTALVSELPEELLRSPTGSAASRTTPRLPRRRAAFGAAHDVVRRRIVVSEADPVLFSGRSVDSTVGPRLGREISKRSRRDRRTSSRLPEGSTQGWNERARSFSGGQRQRLVLTRALLSDRDPRPRRADERGRRAQRRRGLPAGSRRSRRRRRSRSRRARCARPCRTRRLRPGRPRAGGREPPRLLRESAEYRET